MLRIAKENGVEFFFKTKTIGFLFDQDKRVNGVSVMNLETGAIKRLYARTMVINCLGATCNELVSTLMNLKHTSILTLKTFKKYTIVILFLKRFIFFKG